MKMTRRNEAQIKEELKKQRLQKTLEKYPELKGKRIAKKFSEILYAYPDLEELPFEIIIKTGELRELYRKEYGIKWTTQMADARGLRLNKEETYDFPAFEFLKECIICEGKKLGINLCPNCWEKLRMALEIKTNEIKPGWDGWGFEAHCLNLDQVAKLIGLVKKPQGVQTKLKDV